MPTAALSAPRPGPRPSRSRAEIVQCAIRMLDREGPEALTFRAVARELDMTVGALSRYFKNLADLEDEVSAQVMSALRPLDAKSRSGMREQLLRLSMDMLEINRAHPYLMKIQGPASAAVVARLTRQCLKVMVDAGMDFDRAVAIHALVGNLPFAWAAAGMSMGDATHQARIGQAYLDQIGEFASQFSKLLGSATSTAIYRRWLAIYIDALLVTPPVAGRHQESRRG